MRGVRHASTARPRLGAALLALAALALPCAAATAQDPAEVEPEPEPAEAPVEPEEDGLRSQLTEREDKRRPERPWSVPVWGHPLVLTGEWEISLGIQPRESFFGLEETEQEDDRDRYVLEQQLELEAFYSVGEPLSLFAQFEVGMDTFDESVSFFVERGEFWAASENIAGSHVNLEAGRLDFEDERRWWWDDTLDAVRVAYELESFDVSFALARELFPRRTDTDFVDPDDDRVLRLIGELGLDLAADHGLELFLLHHDDRSPTERPDDRVRPEREDDSDARLTWVGGRLLGAFDLEPRGVLGYWLDAALVWGDEELVGFGESEGGRSVVDEVTHRRVGGWGIDLGVNWLAPWRFEPRLYAGWAFGSGDRSPESGSDESFRQTGLQANEAGFGGVQRFAHYGALLDPELSNLQVVTVGIGIALFRASSLDLVYHYYRQVEPTTFLRDARLDPELTGVDRDLGHEIDVVLALEEWAHVELELVGAAFRAGDAFGTHEGRWEIGGYVALRVNF